MSKTDEDAELQNLLDKLTTKNSIYKEIEVRTLVVHSKNHFQSNIPYCLEDYFYRLFCSEINQEPFVKAIVKLYGNTFIEMFDTELYNCIGNNSIVPTKSKAICDKLEDLNDKLNISFQNIKLLKKVGEDEPNMYETELNYGGIGLPFGKNLVRYNFKNKLFKSYQSQLELFFEGKIKEAFKVYDDDKVFEKYKGIFNFKNQNQENKYLYMSDINKIVSVFLSSSIKKKSKGNLLGGNDNGIDNEIEPENAENPKPDGANRFTDGFKNMGNDITKNFRSIKSMLPGAIPKLGPIFKSSEYNPKANGGESGTLKEILDLGIYSKLDLDPIINNNLNCKIIQKYIVNGFEKLLKENVSKHVDEIEIIISNAFSDLMLHIYDEGVSVSNKKVKHNIIHSFVNNYPFDKLCILLKENNLFIPLKQKIQNSDIIKNKMFKLWQSNFDEFIQFMKSKKSKYDTKTNTTMNGNVKQSAKEYILKQIDNFKKYGNNKNAKHALTILSDKIPKVNNPDEWRNVEDIILKFTNKTDAEKNNILDKFNPIGPKANLNSILKLFGKEIKGGAKDIIEFFIQILKLVNTPEKKSAGNIKTKKMFKKGGKKNRTRKPCPKGSRWVKKAQKCMTIDEKNAFMLEYKNNRQNLAHESVVETNEILSNIKSSFRPFDSEKESEVESQPKSEVESQPKSEVESQPKSEVESQPKSEVESQPKSEVESQPKSEVESQPKSEVESQPKSEVESQPKSEKESPKERAFDLKPEQKKCPIGYTQHPKKSRKCVKNEDIRKSSFTKKKKSKIPEIQAQKDVLPVEDISPEQHPIEEKIDEPVAPKEEKVKEYPIDPEKQEYDDYLQNPDSSDSFLYPHLLDPDFNTKIASKKEFSDFRYDGKIQNIPKQSQIECNAPFELLPNQQFVKNFLSIQTPYNSLLLYGGLGTGKTCAAIGVTEEMRMFMKQVGIVKKILIVASPNVQSNFRLQLFDESRLHEIGKKGSGVWNLDTCVGYDLLKEIQTTNMTREYVVRKINTIINEYYDFIGYESLANYIEEMAGLRRSSNNDMEDDGDIDEKRIRRVFDDRLFVIDEVHNIIGKEDNDNKHTSNMMMKLVKYCENLRLLFLSATPMYNSYKEIVWLLNIMNMNDHRSTVKVEQVFQTNGDFVEEVKDENGVILQESGKDILKRKLIGYVSYVRGENPYTFPYRIYPSIFAENENQLQKQTYPKMQMNRTEITAPLQHLEVYVTNMGEYQKKGYDLIVQFSKDYQPNFEEKESFGYTVLQGPISALNMIYPNEELDNYNVKVNPNPPTTGFMGITSIFGGEEESEETESKETESKETESEETESEEEEKPERKVEYTKEQLKEIIRNLHGSKGLQNVISFSKPDANIPLFHDFEYKPEILEKYGRIFNTENISKYSAKIAKICEIISKSTGIVLIYSKFIEGGLIPMALALEELGFQRYGEANYMKSLFKEKPVDFVLNPLTMKPNGPTETFSAKYVMITGQKYYSPNNEADLKLVTDSSNKNGEQVRVVLISEAGSEGLDFKNIRQVHILDPWYNMNRIEQVIGRAVRNKSHCSLPISQRNVEIYLHGTYIDAEVEAADIYLYRLAEKKALQIGKVTRVLKETAVDCLLNIDQKNFTQAKMAQNLNLTLSTNQKVIEFPVGDKPFSNMCDYMETCDFTCSGKPPLQTEAEITPTYDNYFLQNNHPRISKRIRQVFREKVFYTLDDLVSEINIIKPFPIEQVYYSISVFLKNRDEWLVDKKGRKGYLIQKKEVYAFQPLEIANENSSIFERSNPLEYKKKSVPIEMPKDPILTRKPEPTTTTTTTNSVTDEYLNLYNQLKKDVEMVLNTSSYVKPLKQNMNWYRYAKLSVRVCIEKHKIERKVVIQYVIYHHMDCLPLKERLVFLHKLLSTFESFTIINDDSIESVLKQYFLEKIDQSDALKKFVLMNSKNNNVVYSLTKDSRLWKEEPSFPENNSWIQTFQIRKTLLDKVNAESNKDECNVGFIGIFKENYGFKIKNLLNTRPKPGALCDQADKQKLIGKINALLEKSGRTDEIYNKDPVHGQSAIERPNLCIIYEILMRFITDKEKLCWFLSPEQAIASDLDHFIVIPQTLFGITNYVIKS